MKRISKEAKKLLKRFIRKEDKHPNDTYYIIHLIIMIHPYYGKMTVDLYVDRCSMRDRITLPILIQTKIDNAKASVAMMLSQ